MDNRKGGTVRRVVLTAATLVLTPIPASETVAPRGDRTLSMDITEASGEDFESAVTAAQSLGAQATSLSVYWDELETAPGVYNPDPNWLAIANLFYPTKDMRVSLAISVIDTTNLRLPAALAGRPGVEEVLNGWRGFREINTVLYDPDLITVEKMVEILKKTGIYRGTAEDN